MVSRVELVLNTCCGSQIPLFYRHYFSLQTSTTVPIIGHARMEAVVLTQARAPTLVVVPLAMAALTVR